MTTTDTPPVTTLLAQVEHARRIAVQLEQELAAALPERVAQEREFLRDLPDSHLWAVEQITATADDVTSPDAVEHEDALITLAACALHLLAVPRG